MGEHLRHAQKAVGANTLCEGSEHEQLVARQRAMQSHTQHFIILSSNCNKTRLSSTATKLFA